jgi:hypothetical protein
LFRIHFPVVWPRDGGCSSGPLREQARSHTGSSVNTLFVTDTNQLWERACSRRGRYSHHKARCQTAKQALFKRHFQTLTQATHPCAVAYDYARIRRLVRLEAGLYRFRVADESAIGFDRPTQSRRASVQDLIQALSEISCRGGCAWDTFGCAGFLDVRSVNPRTAATLFV